jgi:hypothetical protein
MKHRLLLAVAVAVAASATLVAGTAAGRGHGHGQVYSFSGEVLSAPGPNATSLSVQIETGNRPGLRALIGASQNQVFAVDGGTRFLIWGHGVPHTGSSAELQAGDWVTVRIRTAGGATLQQIESTPAARVADTAPPRAHQPLWLFSGTVAGPQAGGRIALHVQSGNWKALQAMLGQPLDQSFAYDDETIFLLWQGGVPSVIDPSKLQPGDTITVRIRAPRTATLAQVEATPANHVGDHEPAPPPED